MATNGLRGKVLTVTGPIEPEHLGVTLPHEQLLVDLRKLFIKTDLADLKFELKNLGKIRQFPYSVRNNLLVDDHEDIISELKLYKAVGGGAVCDVSPKAVRCKPEIYPKMSAESGIHIVVGTAYYVDPFIPESIRNMTVEQIAATLVRDITTELEGSCGARCGIIGEMGCSSPLTESEEKCLKAAGLAQRQTGAPLTIHPGQSQESPFQILNVLEEAGADISHTVISHLDRTISDDDKLLKLAERGCYLEYDFFGVECSHYQLNLSKDFLNDAQRIQKVKLLVDAGHVNQVLISHDIHSKHRLSKYGGHGLGHILEHIVPKMKERGISQAHVKTMLEDNPRNWLMFS